MTDRLELARKHTYHGWIDFEKGKVKLRLEDVIRLCRGHRINVELTHNGFIQLTDVGKMEDAEYVPVDREEQERMLRMVQAGALADLPKISDG